MALAQLRVSQPSPGRLGSQPSLWLDQDGVPLDLVGRTMFTVLIAYIIVNRVISDRFVLPFGASIRLHEVVLILLGLIWVVWLVREPRPLPNGMVGLSGLALFAIVGLAPFIHALTATPYQANGAERGLMRLFMYTALFLIAFHLAFRLQTGKALLGWLVAATVWQALFAVYEFVVARHVEFLDSLATSIGLVADPLSIRGAVDSVFERHTGEFRAVGTSPHPIVLSAVIALAILVVGLWLLQSSNARQKRWLAAAAGILLLALPVSNSRTGFFIIALAVVPIAIVMLRQTPRMIMWSIPLLAGFALGAVLSPRTPRLVLNTFLNPGADENTTIRIEQTALLPQLLEERPFVGAGYLTQDPEVVVFDNAFNSWLLEMGVVGLGVLLIFLGAAFVACWRAAARATGSERILPLAGVVAVIALLAGGATFDAWTFDQFFPTALILLGLGVGRSAVILHRSPVATSGGSERSPVPAGAD